MSRDALPTLGISMGDPGGIGPEILVKALADRSVRRLARWRIYGCGGALHRAAETAAIEPAWWRVPAGDEAMIETAIGHDVLLVDYDADADRRWAATDREENGAVSFALVEAAIKDAKRPERDPRRTDGFVTGPISKLAWSLAGRGRWPGHTELIGARFGAKRFGMMFVTPRLRVILATAHVPLMEVRNVLTIGKVHEAIDLGAEACGRLGLPRPRIAVCGLNPHAGEAGLLGDEEERLIKPAIDIARGQGLEVTGPHPGDTVWNAAVAGRHDLVVAMYHDQGLIPVKLLDRDDGVNVTVGLPTVRTSPDHGTAFDIAGKNRADAGSMISAMGLAARMALGSAAGPITKPAADSTDPAGGPSRDAARA